MLVGIYKYCIIFKFENKLSNIFGSATRYTADMFSKNAVSAGIEGIKNANYVSTSAEQAFYDTYQEWRLWGHKQYHRSLHTLEGQFQNASRQLRGANILFTLASAGITYNDITTYQAQGNYMGASRGGVEFAAGVGGAAAAEFLCFGLIVPAAMVGCVATLSIGTPLAAGTLHDVVYKKIISTVEPSEQTLKENSDVEKRMKYKF